MSISKPETNKSKNLESALDRIYNLRIKQQNEQDMELFKKNIKNSL